MQFSRASIVVAAALSLAAVSSAQTTPVLFSFNYQDLNGQYDGVNAFSANATAGNNTTLSQIRSHGTVSRNTAPFGAAVNDPGFVANADPAGFALQMTLSNISGTAASGNGAFTITDAEGDTLSGNIGGNLADGLGFYQFGNFVRFFGELSNVQFTPNPNSAFPGDFDGSSFGFFNWASLPLGAGPYTGSIVQLFIYTGGGGFTSGSWGYDPTTQTGTPIPVGLNAQLIPAPGAAALLGLGGVLVGRRRRR